jgi:hypothetical protein
LIASVVALTCPILIARDEAMIALDVTTGVFDGMVRDGVVEDWVVVGDRQLFRARQVWELIMRHRRELSSQVASRTISAAVIARQQARDRRLAARRAASTSSPV